MTPRVLVTGAGGQLGRALRAQADPATVHATFLAHAALDVAAPDAVAQALDALAPDWVVNTAAYTAVDAAERDPDAAWRTNAAGPGVLARACARRGVRLLQLSTDYVFAGTHAGLRPPEAPTEPINAYGRSKRAGERAALEQAPEHAWVLRTGWLFGAEGENFVTRLLARARTQAVLPMVEGQSGTPTWTGHLAAAIWRLVQAPLDAHGPRVLHFAGTPAVSRMDFARAVLAQAQAIGLLARPVQLVPAGPSPAGTAPRPNHTGLDCTATMNMLGPMPRDWRAGLAHTLATLAACGHSAARTPVAPAGPASGPGRAAP